MVSMFTHGVKGHVCWEERHPQWVRPRTHTPTLSKGCGGGCFVLFPALHQGVNLQNGPLLHWGGRSVPLFLCLPPFSVSLTKKYQVCIHHHSRDRGRVVTVPALDAGEGGGTRSLMQQEPRRIGCRAATHVALRQPCTARPEMKKGPPECPCLPESRPTKPQSPTEGDYGPVPVNSLRKTSNCLEHHLLKGHQLSKPISWDWGAGVTKLIRLGE